MPTLAAHRPSDFHSLALFPAATLEEQAVQFLVSAGEASGDMYAAGVVSYLSQFFPQSHFYGCAGPRLQNAGVKPVIDARSLAVVGLAEVVSHLPRIYREYRKLISYAREQRPDALLLTDSPDFHLRLARALRSLHLPVFYLVAPQVWAWRQRRVKIIRELVDQLFCLFPFEEQWFRERGVNATYIGHPLAQLVRRNTSRKEFFDRHGLPPDRRMIVLLPGSRAGEAHRHLPVLLPAAAALRRRFDLSFVLATPLGFYDRASLARFEEPMRSQAIKVVEGETWDAIGHADLALAASGTVTVEAAILGTPMVTFYKVAPLSWFAGRRLVKVPFLSMVNLIAQRQIVPELIQHDMTPDAIAGTAAELLTDTARLEQMRSNLANVRQALSSTGEPLRRAAECIAHRIAGACPERNTNHALVPGDN